MRDATWERMRKRLRARVVVAGHVSKGDDEWLFRYFNDVPILLDEIECLRKER